MGPKFAATFTDLAGVRAVGVNKYVSVSNPERMGNSANIAYGGCALAVAINAAHASLPPTGTYRLYSANGTYLAPALSDRLFDISIRPIRDTITFATRQVEVSQMLDGGKERTVLLMLADFQKPEPKTLLTYSAKPALPRVKVDEMIDYVETRQKMVDDKVIHPKLAKIHSEVFGLMGRHYDQRPHPDGVMSQNLLGMAKGVVTSQDDLPLEQKLSGDFIRTRQDLKTPADNCAALAFFLDGALSFCPLSHNHMFLDDAGACSSLEFALRVFSNDVDLTKWNLREMGTITGGVGRTYSEGRVWDAEDRLVASMTQQSIIRHPPEKKMKEKEKL